MVEDYDDQDLKHRREAKYFAVITELNKQHRQGDNEIFDCGGLGFVHIWWQSGWKRRWFMPSQEFK